MASYETIRDEVRAFGENAYLEVARRKLKDETGEFEFLLISRGYYAAGGEKKWTKFVTVPDDPDVRAWLSQAILRA